MKVCDTPTHSHPMNVNEILRATNQLDYCLFRFRFYIILKKIGDTVEKITTFQPRKTRTSHRLPFEPDLTTFLPLIFFFVLLQATLVIFHLFSIQRKFSSSVTSLWCWNFSSHSSPLNGSVRAHKRKIVDSICLLVAHFMFVVFIFIMKF